MCSLVLRVSPLGRGEVSGGIPVAVVGVFFPLIQKEKVFTSVLDIVVVTTPIVHPSVLFSDGMCKWERALAKWPYIEIPVEQLALLRTFLEEVAPCSRCQWAGKRKELSKVHVLRGRRYL